MKADGSDSRVITNMPTGADGVTVSPDGKLILFTSDVLSRLYPRERGVPARITTPSATVQLSFKTTQAR